MCRLSGVFTGSICHFVGFCHATALFYFCGGKSDCPPKNFVWTLMNFGQNFSRGLGGKPVFVWFYGGLNVKASTQTSTGCYALQTAFKWSWSHFITKPTKWYVHPAKTQISLGICPDWLESSLCAQWVGKDSSFLQTDSEDWSDWMDAQAHLGGHICHFVGFVMMWVISFLKIVQAKIIFYLCDLSLVRVELKLQNNFLC